MVIHPDAGFYLRTVAQTRTILDYDDNMNPQWPYEMTSAHAPINAVFDVQFDVGMPQVV